MFLPPVRCFSCSAFVGGFYSLYETALQHGSRRNEAFETLGIHRICCRRMLMTFPNQLETVEVGVVPVADTYTELGTQCIGSATYDLAEEEE